MADDLQPGADDTTASGADSLAADKPAKKAAARRAPAKKAAAAKTAAKRTAAKPADDAAEAVAYAPVEESSPTALLFQAPEPTKKAPARRPRKTAAQKAAE